jgi:hypothetical protein
LEGNLNLKENMTKKSSKLLNEAEELLKINSDGSTVNTALELIIKAIRSIQTN